MAQRAGFLQVVALSASQKGTRTLSKRNMINGLSIRSVKTRAVESKQDIADERTDRQTGIHTLKRIAGDC